MLTRSWTITALAGVMIVASSNGLAAQESEPPRVRALAEVSGLRAMPLGEFRDRIGDGYGVALGLRVPFHEAGAWSIRVDGSVINYGHEAAEICFSSTSGCRVRAKQTTSNDIASLLVGPELTHSLGLLEPYVVAQVGGAVFITSSSLRGQHTANQHDVAFAWGGTGGVRLRLPVTAVPAHLNLAARYQNNGRVEYLREGDITDLPDGSLLLNRQRSRADLVSVQFGASVGLRRPGRSQAREQ